MKPSLPICIPAIPSHDASPEIWRQVAPILQAIAEREQKRKLKDDRAIATNALFVAQYLSYKHQWSSLWQSLLDRDVLHIGESPKLQPPKARPEPELETIAEPPPKPKTQRPTKPPKNVEEKPKTVGKKKRRKRVRNRQRLSDRKSPTFATTIAQLRATLIRLRVFLWFCNWVAYSAKLCPRQKPPIIDRADGERNKAILRPDLIAKGICPRLRVWLPSIKDFCKIPSQTLEFMIEKSKLERTCIRKRAETKEKRIIISPVTADHLNQVLTNKWQDTTAIASKLNDLIPNELFTPVRVGRLLPSRKNIHHLSKSNKAYFSLIEATEFESDWINLADAYQIAKSRGCTAPLNTFRKTHRFDYSAYGLEFRKAAPDTECSLLRYRDIQA